LPEAAEILGINGPRDIARLMKWFRWLRRRFLGVTTHFLA